MHEWECPDSNVDSLDARALVRAEWMRAWPTGTKTDIATSALPAANAVTAPIRLIGEGDWLAVWGNFTGYRLGYSPRESFVVQSGAVMRYPHGVDLFESADAINLGTVSRARFCSRQAALDFIGDGGEGGLAVLGGGIKRVSTIITQSRSATAAGETQLVAATPARSGLWVQNVGGVLFGLRMGTGEPTTVELVPGAAWEMPAGICYTGAVFTIGGVSTAAHLEY